MSNVALHKVKFVTLGCKLNFSESATIGQQLLERGIATTVMNDEVPDICVVNTCSVTSLADRKESKAARFSLSENKNLCIIMKFLFLSQGPEGQFVLFVTKKRIDTMQVHWI